ncbi:MAG: hypothetical protein JOZ51_19560 [Chloroflexi bacterium]|nr:hypothetical protein [Chloroflexota bacterium]
MELRYHSCGCPIRVWEACPRRDGEPTFFDGRSHWTECAIRSCPRCGRHLSRWALRTTPPAPTGTLAAYMLIWPALRQQLEGLIAEHARDDPTFRPDHAQAEIQALEAALNRVTDLAALLEEPAQPAVEAETCLEALAR